MARAWDAIWLLVAAAGIIVGLLTGIWIILLPIGAIAGLLGLRRRR